MNFRLSIGLNIILFAFSCYFAWQNEKLKEKNYKLGLVSEVDSATVVQAIKSNVAGKHDDSLHYLKSLVGSKEIPLKKMIDLEYKAGRLTDKQYEKAKIPDDFEKKRYPFPRYITQ